MSGNKSLLLFVMMVVVVVVTVVTQFDGIRVYVCVCVLSLIHI